MKLKNFTGVLLVLALMLCFTCQAYALEVGESWTDDTGVEYSVRYVYPEEKIIEYPEPFEALRKPSGEGTNEHTNGADWYGLTWSEDGSDSIGVYVYRTDSNGDIPKTDNKYRVLKAVVSNCYDPQKNAELFELPNGDLFLEVYGCTNSSSAFDTENENFDLAFALVRPTENSFELLKIMKYSTYRCAGEYTNYADGAQVDFKSNELFGGHRDDLALETVAKVAEQFFADDKLSFNAEGAYVNSMDSSYQVPMPSLNTENKEDKDNKEEIVSVCKAENIQDLPELFSLYN